MHALCGDALSPEVATAGRRLLATDPADPSALAPAARRFGAFCASHRMTIDDASSLVAVHVSTLRRRERAPWADAHVALALGAGWAQCTLDEPGVVTPEDLIDFL